ncbi:MAG: ParB/RepB/Spo0J family partition protein [Marinosulfonomonas sp.]
MNKIISTLPRPVAKSVKLEQLTTDEDTFQPRTGNVDSLHVAQLADTIKRVGELDPLLVWEDPGTNQLTVADGHHRFAAYTKLHWSAGVPVKVYKCEKAVALQLSMLENRKTHKNLYDSERRNFAWMRVREGSWTKREIVSATNISEGTVKNMRRVMRAIEAVDQEPPETWTAARRLAKANMPEGCSAEEYERVVVARAKEKIGPELTKLLDKFPAAAGAVFKDCAGDNLELALRPIGYYSAAPEIDDCPF